MWQSLTGPAMSRRCWSAIEEIERRLVETPREASSSVPARQDPVLASGDAGVALFFAYLDAVRPGSAAADHALAALDRSVAALSGGQFLPTLYSGYCGIGWVVEHLTRELFEGDDDLVVEIDAAVETILADVREAPPYELIGGLAGFGVYLVERLPHPGAVRLLTRVLDLLASSAEESGAGVTWHTRPEWLTTERFERMPAGCYNLGVAHGVPGVLGFLAAAQREGVEDPRLARLAEGVVRWLSGQKLPPGGDSVYPAYAVPGVAPEPTRTAWCYGDLGIAAVLLSAARSFGRADWETEALSLARLAARRPIPAVQAVDAGLCHGTAGLAHVFNRLHQATGDPELKETALKWYQRALDMQLPGAGQQDGWMSWISLVPGEGSWRRERGFLTGLAGIGLALLAAVSEREPAWDRVMLLGSPSYQAR